MYITAATALFLFLCSPVLVHTCWGADGATLNKTPAEHLTLTVGKSVIIDTNVPVGGVSVAVPDKEGDKEVAKAVVVPPNQVYLSGKSVGETNLTIWGGTNKIAAIYDVEVVPDAATLKRKLYEIFPDEKGISVTTTNDNIMLSGTVSGTATMAHVVAVAQSYAPLDKGGKQRLTNLLEVAGVQQVMLEVRVSEMSRSLTRKLGLNFSELSASGRPFGLSLLDNFVKLPSSGGWPGNPLSVSDNVNMIFGFLAGGASWTVFIDALKENGLLHVLAEPTLITLSGKPASFLAGGEFPIPVPQGGSGSSTITIEYKPFGVGLGFTPTVLGNGRISMIVSPEVSELDFSQGVSLQGFIIPSVTTRRVSTTVELGDGQSFAIAGLIKEEVKNDIRKFPVLGDVPVLGALFRSSSFIRNETELVIIVTPHLVKPLDLAKQTLPTDAYSDPNDFEFYLEGRLEGRDGSGTGSALPRKVKKGGLEGDFGYILPLAGEEK